MIKYLTPITFAFLLTTGVANAEPVKSGNQAVTVCKAHLKANIEGFKRARLKKIRSSRSEHTVIFSVSDETGRSNTTCTVNKADGSISIAV